MRMYCCTTNEDGVRLLTVDGRALPIIRWYGREEEDFVLTLLWDY